MGGREPCLEKEVEMNILTAIRLLIALARALEIPPDVIAGYWNDLEGGQQYYDELLSIVSGEDDTPVM